MKAGQYFEFIQSVRVSGEMHSQVKNQALSDGSTFKYFTSKEVAQGRANYFVQGVLAKKYGQYYVTITSPKSFPTSAQWPTLMETLASVRAGSSSPDGKRRPPPGRSTQVLNVALDGSILKIPFPYELTAWGYTRRFGTPLHTFRSGPILYELCRLKVRLKNDRQMIADLRADYFKGSGLRFDDAVLTKELKNGVKIHYHIVGLPRRDDDPRKQYMLEGAFSRGRYSYYYLAAAARDEIANEEFEKQATRSLSVLGGLSWP